jgi:hypothetical protein
LALLLILQRAVVQDHEQLPGLDAGAVLDHPVDGGGIALGAGPHLTDDVAVVRRFNRPLLGDGDDQRFLLDGVQQYVGAGVGRAQEGVPADGGEDGEQQQQAERERGDAPPAAAVRRQRLVATARPRQRAGVREAVPLAVRLARSLVVPGCRFDC